jgi:modification methylase
VRADGSIISARHRGSIHQVGAAVQGAPSCNGWTFWLTDRYGAPAPIDVLRRKLRAELN